MCPDDAVFAWGAGLSQGSASFLKKKKQKTFDTKGLRKVAESSGPHHKPKSFGSFLQKRTPPLP
jgi:hypothetical protein